MRKIYISNFTVVLLLFVFGAASAQQLDSSDVLNLITKNASALNLSKGDIRNSHVTNAYEDKVSKLKFVYLQQTFQDIPVYNTIQVIAFKNDKPVSVTGGRIFGIEQQIENKRALTPVSPEKAVSVAAASVNISTSDLRTTPLTLLKTSANRQMLEFAPQSLSKENITVQLLWFPIERGKVKLGWQVKLLPHNTSDYWLIKVDAQNGSILGKDNITVSDNWGNPNMGNQKYEPVLSQKSIQPAFVRKPMAINSAQYQVVPFPAESMNHTGGTPTLMNNPWLMAGSGNNATSLMWHNDGANEYTYTRGNNVWAMEDTTGNDLIRSSLSAHSSSAAPDLLFNFPFDPNANAFTSDNLKFGITNLFYWNNIVHDITYQYGFDEPAGNFQKDNLGRGGTGNDYVVANAQDGSGLDNANFATPPDGQRPLMQMYLWDGNSLTKLTINSTPYAGAVPKSIEGQVSKNNKLIKAGPVTGDLVLYDDGGTGHSNLACNAAANAISLNGKIAVIDRGDCDFIVKIKNAQNAGAIAALIVNNVADQLVTMQGDDNTIAIPAIMILKDDGDLIKSLLSTSTVNVTLKALPQLDGDLDNGIITHEYTHGISNRLTGGPAAYTCLQNKEQMGEGWSDYYALMITTNWQTATINDGTLARSIGTYVTNEDPATGQGIRSYPYSTNMSVNPLTYSKLLTLGDNSAHDVGEVWTAVLWDMTWNIIQMDGINTNIYNADGAGGNSAALKLVTLGMKLQPCSPGFVDGRDALLEADEILYDGKYRCAIWSAFGRRGMGVNAKQGSSLSISDQVEDFTIPSGGILRKTVDKVETPQNGILTYKFTVSALCTPVTNYKIVDTLPSNVTYVSGGTYNSSDRTVTFSISSLAPLQSQNFTLSVKVNDGTWFLASDLFSEPVANNAVPATFTTSTTLSGSSWDASTYFHSIPYALKTAYPTEGSEQILASASAFAIEDHTQLSFWHQFNTEPGKDGGVVELSLDGTNWFDAEPYIASNGYNSTINTNSSLEGKNAFSGISSGFINTVVNLSSFKGQSIFFRFRFVTDSTGNIIDFNRGWSIDDILIRKSPAVYNIAKLFDQNDKFKSLSDTITAITTVVLPVIWGEFSVRKQGENGLLKWSTLQESNSKSFAIERSEDGSNFATIATLTARGNSSTKTEYSYRDKNPVQGNNFYRLRLTDLDGSSTYSEIKMLVFDQLSSKIILSPNPVKSSVSLYLAGNKEPIVIKLLDATGRLIKTFEMKSEKYQLPVSALSEGVYYLHFNGKNFNEVKKFVKGR